MSVANLVLGETVLFNSPKGTKLTAIVTKIYEEENTESDLDLHILGGDGNTAFARSKLKVSYGINTNGKWQYPSKRLVYIDHSDPPKDGEGLLYSTDKLSFTTEKVKIEITEVDGGWF